MRSLDRLRLAPLVAVLFAPLLPLMLTRAASAGPAPAASASGKAAAAAPSASVSVAAASASGSVAVPSIALEVGDDPKEILAKPGGLTSEMAAQRAVATSKQAKIDEAKLSTAAAAVDVAWDAVYPRLAFTARYTRLSPIDTVNLGGSGSFVAAPVQPGEVVTPGTPLVGAGFSFPVILNQYVLQAALTVPVSDYVFRIFHNHEAALKSVDAAKWQQKVSAAQAATDARVAYYNWLRARGAVVIAKAAVAQSEAHLRDLNTQLLLKAATTADVYRVEAQLANAQLVVIQSENLVMVTEANLRLLMHASDDEAMPLGEDLLAELPNTEFELKTLKGTALSKRPELQAIDAQIASSGETKKAISAGLYPRLDFFADFFYSKPNQRYVPAVDQFKPSWDLGLQLTWSPNDYLVTKDQEKQVDTNVATLKATREQIVDALGLEVISAFSKVREAEASIVATASGLRSAKEAYRVRLEQFHAGATTSALLIDTESDLTRARLQFLNAKVDLRIARANLRKAIGET